MNWKSGIFDSEEHLTLEDDHFHARILRQYYILLPYLSFETCMKRKYIQVYKLKGNGNIFFIIPNERTFETIL